MKQLNLHFKWLVMSILLCLCSSAWADGTTGIINFGSAEGSTQIKGNSSSGTGTVTYTDTGTDSQGNTWTITTVTSNAKSFTQSNSYSQVGAAQKPVTSITFTTTLVANVNITALSAQFGGFSNTAGTVTLKVGDTTVGTGSLNGSNDVTVSSSTSEVGKVLTITVTDIAKGVKCYNISYTYTSSVSNHNATFSVNGTTTTQEFAAGAAITFPANPADIDGKKFMGWVSEEISGTTDTEPTFVTSAKMGDADVTYYAVFAEEKPGSLENTSMTIDANTANIPTSYAAENDYTLNNTVFSILQMFKNGDKLQWRAAGNSNGTGTMYNKDALQSIQSIVLNYDSSDSNKNFTIKVGDSANPTNGTSITPTISGNVYTFDCSNNTKNYFLLENGTNAGYLTSIVINYQTGTPPTYSSYCTTVVADTRANPELSFTPTSVEGTIGEQFEAPTLTFAAGFNGAVEYESSDETVAQIMDTETGDLMLMKEGTATITATFAGDENFKPGSASYTLTVTDNRIATTTTYDNIVLDLADIATLTRLAPVVKDADDKVISYSYDEWPTEMMFEIVSDEDGLIGYIDNNTGEIILNGVVGTATLKAFYNYFNVNSTYKPSECTFTITIESPLADIAALTEETASGTYNVNLTNAVVTYVNGKNAYIQDASGAIKMFKDGHGLNAGDVLNGKATVEYQIYNGNPQITSLTGVEPASGVAPEPTTIAAADWAYTFSDVISQYFKITGATITQSGNKYYVELAGENIQLYPSNVNLSAINLTKKYTITGFPTMYNTIKELQIFVSPEEEVEPSIEVATTTVNAPAVGVDDGNIEVTYTAIATDPEIVWYTTSECTATTSEPTWIDVDFDSNNNIEFVIEANTGETRTAYFKVYALDAETNDIYSELITIYQAAYVEPGVNNYFVKVTATADITNGEYLLVNEDENVAFDGSLTTLDKVDNVIDIVADNNVIEADDDIKAATFTIDVANGTLRSASGKYIGQNSYANGLLTSDVSTDYTNSFSIDEGNNAVISIATSNTNSVTLRYNSASNQNRFRYYKSGQESIQLYKKLSATLNASGYGTFASTVPVDFSNAKDYTAWAITNISSTTITFSQITGAVPAGTGVLLKGTANATVYPVVATESGTAVDGNKLEGITTATAIDADTYYGLSGNMFVKVNAGTVPGGKALLPASAIPSNVKTLNFVFEGETTGIEEISGAMEEGRRGCYDLQGRKVTKPAHGLYIVNGKKVMIK